MEMLLISFASWRHERLASVSGPATILYWSNYRPVIIVAVDINWRRLVCLSFSWRLAPSSGLREPIDQSPPAGFLSPDPLAAEQITKLADNYLIRFRGSLHFSINRAGAGAEAGRRFRDPPTGSAVLINRRRRSRRPAKQLSLFVVGAGHLAARRPN